MNGERVYHTITLGNLVNFSVKKLRDRRVQLEVGRCRNSIIIDIPFVLNEKVAKLVGMMPDGSISKTLTSVMFSQKKEPAKINNFEKLLRELFGINHVRTWIDKTGTTILQAANKPLAIFMHDYLGVPTSAETYRVPKWVIKSPFTVVKAYVSEVFAMEGSVCDPTTGKKEARLHSCDFFFMKDMQNLLEKRLGISSSIFTYRIKNYGEKFYLRIGRRDDLLKLRDIGIALTTHQQRLERVCNSYKPETWKISLIAASRLPSHFTSENLATLLRISKRATLQRIGELKARGLVDKNLSWPPSHSLTKLGWKLTYKISPAVKIQPVRTNSRENEEKVKNALEAGLKTKHDIARFAGITHTTVREVLMRMRVRKLRQYKISAISS